MRATHKDYIPLCRCQGTFEHGQVVVVEEVVLEVSMVDDVEFEVADVEEATHEVMGAERH
jgi:hypothetical protein